LLTLHNAQVEKGKKKEAILAQENKSLEEDLVGFRFMHAPGVLGLHVLGLGILYGFEH
jgi:hypothetical protein